MSSRLGLSPTATARNAKMAAAIAELRKLLTMLMRTSSPRRRGTW